MSSVTEGAQVRHNVEAGGEEWCVCVYVCVSTLLSLHRNTHECAPANTQHRARPPPPSHPNPPPITPVSICSSRGPERCRRQRLLKRHSASTGRRRKSENVGHVCCVICWPVGYRLLTSIHKVWPQAQVQMEEEHSQRLPL